MAEQLYRASTICYNAVQLLVPAAPAPTMPPMRHVISALVMNEPGVLALVAGLFSARGFNIDSLVVGRTEDPNLSRMTIVCTGDDNTLDQIRKQLAKLVPVAKVRDFKDASYIERDLVLMTVDAEVS